MRRPGTFSKRLEANWPNSKSRDLSCGENLLGVGAGFDACHRVLRLWCFQFWQFQLEVLYLELVEQRLKVGMINDKLESSVPSLGIPLRLSEYLYCYRDASL